MTKHWILFSLLILVLSSCGSSSLVTDTERPLLGGISSIEKIDISTPEVIKQTYIVSLKETILRKYSNTTSSSNPEILNGEITLGSSALILTEDTTKKQHFLKLQLSNGTKGWTTDTYIIRNAKPAVVTSKYIHLYKKADISSHTDNKVDFGEKVILGESSIGGFHEVMLMERVRHPTSYWIKEKDVQNISIESNDYILASYLEELKTSNSEDENWVILNIVKSNQDYVSSLFYSQIMNFDDQLLNDSLYQSSFSMDSIDLDDDFQ